MNRIMSFLRKNKLLEYVFMNVKNKKLILLFLLIIFLIIVIWGKHIFYSNTNISEYFDKIKNNQVLLEDFLNKMPKGADLHAHIGGTEYPENLIKYGADGNFCMEIKDFKVYSAENCRGNYSFREILNNYSLYNSVINNWSMRDFTPGKETTYQHFFSIFKTDAIISKYLGEILSNIAQEAAEDQVTYIELQTTDGDEAADKIAEKITWRAGLIHTYQELMNKGINDLANQIVDKTRHAEIIKNNKLQCGTENPLIGCNVTIKYQHAALRNSEPKEVFAQILLGFILASKSDMYVGVNLVDAENGFISLRDYNLQMKMFNFLHKLYPDVKIDLHAGEFSREVVEPKELRFHIRNAVEIGMASRIGHGIDIIYESDATKLLQEMSRKKILVEIALTSENKIWGITENNNPIKIYLSHHVPVSIVTDDAGILRTSLNQEFRKAIMEYDLSYEIIKNLIRNSVSYSFLPGKNLWKNEQNYIPVDYCREVLLGSDKLTIKCKAFLEANPKAKMQWNLEKQLYDFERAILNQ